MNKTKPFLAIVDYDAGNLRSVAKAFEKVGYPATVTSDPSVIVRADGIIMPGVGASAQSMASLAQRGLVDAVKEVILVGKPFLGVCLGLQLLLSESDEGHRHPCLDLVTGRVRRLPEGMKVPHMGWNQVHFTIQHPIFAGVPDRSNFYFVHSYHVVPQESAVIAAETEYENYTFCSAIIRDNLIGTQFHPEKSGELGLRMYHNFGRLVESI
ncbi:MAG: imidazole glycerol phosphate synthase subunit HisH [Chloroflexota bacterium]|nr:MAG: imidazole glycerol phosphate synthase subunit HisH [Chloroflexota bacterium]